MIRERATAGTDWAVRARERVLEDFEKAQKGGSRAGGSSNSIIKAPVAVAGAKRKFVESEEMDSMLRSAEEAALKQLEEEQVRQARAPTQFSLPYTDRRD